MKWAWRSQLLNSLLGLTPRLVRVQATTPPAPFFPILPSVLGAGAPPSPSGGHGVLAFFLLTAAAVTLLAALATAVDFRQKREGEALELQTSIGDALLGGRAFVGCSVTPTVRIPFWRGSPARIELTGEVPAPHLEQAALRLAAEVASRIRSDFTIANRMAVVSSPLRRAA